MKKIKLSQGKFALIDDEDFDRVNMYNWYTLKGYNTYYAIRDIVTPDGKKSAQKLHRFILNLKESKPDVDHIDGNGLNNCKNNLRLATRSENMQNVGKHKRNKSGFKGVCWDKKSKKFIAQIQINGKKIYLGQFTTAKDASNAYENRAKLEFGQFYKQSK